MLWLPEQQLAELASVPVSVSKVRLRQLHSGILTLVAVKVGVARALAADVLAGGVRRPSNGGGACTNAHCQFPSHYAVKKNGAHSSG